MRAKDQAEQGRGCGEDGDSAQRRWVREGRRTPGCAASAADDIQPSSACGEILSRSPKPKPTAAIRYAANESPPRIARSLAVCSREGDNCRGGSDCACRSQGDRDQGQKGEAGVGREGQSGQKDDREDQRQAGEALPDRRAPRGSSRRRPGRRCERRSAWEAGSRCPRRRDGALIVELRRHPLEL